MNSTWKRLALGAGLGIAAGCLGVLAMSSPAHADDSQRPGGALDTVVSEVVDQVLPETEPEPSKEPEPEPEAPAEPEPEPRQEPADEPADEPDPVAVVDVPPVEVPVDVPVVVDPPIVDVPPVVVDLPPVVDVPPVVVPVPVVPAPTVPTPAPVTPAPAQPTEPAPLDIPATVDPPAEQPLPAPVVEVVEVVDLPAVIGPVGSSTTLAGLPPWTASTDRPDREPQCTDDRDEAEPDHGRGVVRTITDRRTGQPTADRQPAPIKPCPTPAGPDGQAITAGSVKPPPPTGEQLVALTAAGTYSAPVLHRLTQLRPRGDLPAGRTEHPEPGPA